MNVNEAYQFAIFFNNESEPHEYTVYDFDLVLTLFRDCAKNANTRECHVYYSNGYSNKLYTILKYVAPLDY